MLQIDSVICYFYYLIICELFFVFVFCGCFPPPRPPPPPYFRASSVAQTSGTFCVKDNGKFAVFSPTNLVHLVGEVSVTGVKGWLTVLVLRTAGAIVIAILSQMTRGFRKWVSYVSPPYTHSPSPLPLHISPPYPPPHPTPPPPPSCGWFCILQQKLQTFTASVWLKSQTGFNIVLCGSKLSLHCCNFVTHV